MLSTEVAAVMDKLDDWAASFTGGLNPVPVLTLGGNVMSVSIGDVHVWDDENGYADECDDERKLTFDRAVSCYKTVVGAMAAWPEPAVNPNRFVPGAVKFDEPAD